jgi:hypothetical protein
LDSREETEMGALYRRGQVWWCKYYVNGRPVRESTGVAGDTDTAPAEARRFLKVKEGKAASGEPVLRRADRVRYEEIRKDLLEHYATTGRRNAAELGWRLKHLDRFFAGRRAVHITRALVTAYVARRQEQGASNGTINRELATLGPMMRLAYKHDKAARLLLVERLKESAPRAGFFEEEQYRAVTRHLPADLQVVAAIAYRFGWRARSEILPLERRHLDLEQGTLALDPGMTKNDDGRKVYLTPDLKALLVAQVARVGGPPAQARPDHPGPVPASHRQARGRPAHGVLQGVADRLPQGRRAGDADARLPAHRRAQHGAHRRAALGRHEAHRPPHRGRLPALRDRERRGPPGGECPARGHNLGHSGRDSAQGAWYKVAACLTSGRSAAR